MSARCRSCNAPVIWTVAKTGRRMPVDAEPAEGGTVALIRYPTEPDRPPGAIVLGGVMLADAIEQEQQLHKSHFATCPNASKHRRQP